MKKLIITIVFILLIKLLAAQAIFNIIAGGNWGSMALIVIYILAGQGLYDELADLIKHYKNKSSSKTF